MKRDTQNKAERNYYDVILSCNSCGRDEVLIDVKVYGDNYCDVYEAATKCNYCGFEDYWEYGRFESSSEGYNKCKKYFFDHDNDGAYTEVKADEAR